MDPKDRRVKREIANSNERRRMQSINAGFLNLKRLLPVNDNEKMSKAAILQHAADFIQELLKERLRDGASSNITTIIETINPTTTPTTTSRNKKSTNKKSENREYVEQTNTKIDTTPTNIENINNNKNNNANKSNSSKSSNSSGDSASTPEDCLETVATTTTTTTASPTITITSNGRAHRNVTRANADNTNHSVVRESTKKQTNSRNSKLDQTNAGVAAIALPLEVPYIRMDKRHSDNIPASKKIVKTEVADSQDPASKGQTLDTICKAIMEIEGDRVFT